jgi:uridine kinase
MRRISFDLLMAATGLSFFLVVLATPAPPGWYLWLVPFLVMHQLQGERTEWLLVGGFSVLLIGLHLFISGGARLPLQGLDPQIGLAIFAAHMTSQLHSLAYTAIASVGLIVLAHMLRERVARNDYFRIAQRPLSLAIAGDSGAGKDTLCRALAGLFGEHSVVHVSGDDYHVWDRFAPMWEGMTHLDPRANDLQRFSSDVLALIDGKPIHCRRYDHVAGRFNRSTRSDRNDVVIASGLHALHIAPLCERFDVKIFLDIDEGLRRSWKIHRDVQQRGHERNAVQASIERRAIDARRYIYPQQATANLVLRLQPVNARHLETQTPDAIRLKLSAQARDCTSSERVARTLIGLCGLHLDMQPSRDSGEVEMTIEGDVVAEDIALAARTLAPGLQEMLDHRPQWLDGMSGIMQLLVLIQIEEALKRRIR